MITQENHLKTNKFMRKKGFTWVIYPGTAARPNPCEGEWQKDGVTFTQDQAVYIYQTLRRRWL